MRLNVNHVYKSYVENTGHENYVLQDVNFIVEKSEFVCLLGHSGCGKSTLLNLIAGYIKPDKGSIVIDNNSITGPSSDRGVVFQEYALFPWYSVIENVSFGLEVRGLKKEESRQIAREYISLVGLEGYENKYPTSLSGGMKQRVGIARALANKPKILLMDEPFGALDALTRDTMRKELLNIWLKLKPTVIFITHSVPEAVYLADKVILLKDGIIDVSVDIDLPRPRDTKCKEFLNYVEIFENHLIGEMDIAVNNE